MHYCTEKSWYVLRVRSQAERLVHVRLHHKQFEVLNPTYQELSIRRDRRKVLTRPIFNGYMFVRMRSAWYTLGCITNSLRCSIQPIGL